ncbi:TPA: hypothetical protein IQB15_002300 [Listeria monocytogenes]|nr:hypothetical protein [Listeria monocytogenes]
MKVTTDKSVMNKAIRELDQLDRYSLQIGLFGEDDSFIQMIAGVHEFGLTIRPKVKYLTIPTPEAGERRARDIPGLFKPKGKNILAVAGPGGKLTVMFYLKTEVNIPERSFLRSTFDEKSNKWGELFEGWIDNIVRGELTAEQVYNRLGAKIVDDIQMKIVEIQTPAKSGATLAMNPQKNNPLVVSGRMKNSVTWKVMRK